MLAITTALAMLISLSAGCGGSPETTTGALTEKLTTTKIHGTDPIDTGLLLSDTSELIQATTSADKGVHFTFEKYETTGGGATVYNWGNGDMAAGSVNMVIRNSVGGEPHEIDLIATAGQTYTQPASGAWQASSLGLIAPDVDTLVNYLDFARSSRNFGQESLVGNIKTYHVQVDVDSTLAIEAAKKRTRDPAALVSLEAMKGVQLSVDLWIGWDNNLVYQEKVVIGATPDVTGSETTYQYSDWGKPVSIARPCDAC